MRIQLFTTTLAAALAVGLGAAVAAPQQPLNLSARQKQTIQQQLSGKTAQAVPANFTAQVGAMVPQSLILHPVPKQVASKVKAVSNDAYAKLKNSKILIVNPTDRKVAAVISESRSTTGVNPSSMRQHPSNNTNAPNRPK
jgi:hypothetical protein